MGIFDEKVTRGKSISVSKTPSGGGQSSEKKPNELILKVASNIKGNNSDASIDYITRNKAEHEPEQFIEPFNEVGETLNKEELKQLKSDWKTEFSDPKKIKTRNMTHLVFSIDVEPTKKNKENFEKATKEFLQKRFGEEGFRYVAVMHDDTKKPHFHVLVNNNNLETGKKLRIDMSWHYESRAMAKDCLKKHGIDQEASFKKDRQFLDKDIKASEKDYKHVSNWFDAKLKTASRNDEHFNLLKKQWEILNAVKEGKPTVEMEVQTKGAEIVKHGSAHYEFDKTNKESYYVTLSNGATIWGVGLESAINNSGAKIGDKVTIERVGSEAVTVQDKHGKEIKTQRAEWKVTPVNEVEVVKESFKKSLDDRYSTQQQIEFNRLLKQLKADMVAYDNYNHRSTANNAVRQAIKAAQPEESLIKKALGIHEKKVESQVKKEARDRYFLAKELVKGEAIIRASDTIPKAEKKQLIQNIEHHKKNLTEKGVDVKRIEIEHHSLLSDNKQYVTAMKSLNAAVKGTDRQIKADGELDKAAAEKRVYRLLDSIHTAKSSELTKHEAKRLDNAEKSIFADLQQKGVDVPKFKADWQQGRQIKDEINHVLQSSKAPLAIGESELVQKRIFELREQLKQSPVGLGKKEMMTLNVNLNKSQSSLDRQLNNGFDSHQKTLSHLVKSFEVIDSKISIGEKVKADKQAFAMGKSLLGLQAQLKESALLPSQKEAIQRQVSVIEKHFEARGYSVDGMKRKVNQVEIVKEQVEKMRTMTMERARVKGFDNVVNEISELKKSVKSSELTRDTKREFSKAIKESLSNIDKARLADSQKLANLMIKITEISNKIKYLSSPENTKSLTNLEKLNNRREIESHSQQLSSFIKEAGGLVRSVPDKNLQREFSSQINRAKAYTQNQGIDRSR